MFSKASLAIVLHVWSACIKRLNTLLYTLRTFFILTQMFESPTKTHLTFSALQVTFVLR